MKTQEQHGSASPRPVAQETPNSEPAEEVLILDSREGLTPSDMVEGKLEFLLHGAAAGQPTAPRRALDLRRHEESTGGRRDFDNARRDGE